MLGGIRSITGGFGGLHLYPAFLERSASAGGGGCCIGGRWNKAELRSRFGPESFHLLTSGSRISCLRQAPPPKTFAQCSGPGVGLFSSVLGGPARPVPANRCLPLRGHSPQGACGFSSAADTNRMRDDILPR